MSLKYFKPECSKILKHFILLLGFCCFNVIGENIEVHKPDSNLHHPHQHHSSMYKKYEVTVEVTVSILKDLKKHFTVFSSLNSF